MQTISLGYTPRAAFVAFHKRRQRWGAIAAHRRAGKTVACVGDLIDAALRCELDEPRFAYVAPTFTQAKDIAWGYLKRFTQPIPGITTSESELSVTLPNQARIRLYGADNYDRMRGLYLDGVVLDEYALIDPRAWPEVIRPALSDRRGWALFMGTPKGQNDFYEKVTEAKRTEDWFSLVLKASESGILPEDELADARRSMSQEQFDQEYECSFEAAVPGAYYGRLMRVAEDEGRITRVPHDPMIEVETWWDLGVGDSTVIWFAQRAPGGEVRLIDYYEAHGEGLPHYRKVLSERPYNYSRHVAPHDIEVRELGSGRSRKEMADELGLRFEVAPKLTVEDGVEAVRMLIPRCVFDAEKCKVGVDALKWYQAEFNDKMKVFKTTPRHDWASHAADAFRYGAIARAPARFAPIKYLERMI
ncbi:MAG: hypothetical protein RJB58_1207 [Pseudomonadota bacterium]